MKSKIVISIGLIMATTLCFAQHSKPIAELPAKGTLIQTSPNGAAATVAEGKKGLNAVNVKQAKQAGSVNENGRTTNANGKHDENPFPPKSTNTKATKYPCMNPSEADSTSNVLQTKHAINTKGTGATRDK